MYLTEGFRVDEILCTLAPLLEPSGAQEPIVFRWAIELKVHRHGFIHQAEPVEESESTSVGLGQVQSVPLLQASQLLWTCHQCRSTSRSKARLKGDCT